MSARTGERSTCANLIVRRTLDPNATKQFAVTLLERLIEQESLDTACVPPVPLRSILRLAQHALENGELFRDPQTFGRLRRHAYGEAMVIAEPRRWSCIYFFFADRRLDQPSEPSALVPVKDNIGLGRPEKMPTAAVIAS
jgi:hypothetical protein